MKLTTPPLFTGAVLPSASIISLTGFSVLFLSLLSAYISRPNRRRQRLPLPPGPSGFPYIGQAFSFPKKAARFKVFADWATTYGDLVYTRLGAQSLLLVGGDGTLVHELFNKRGAIYSGRPNRQQDILLDQGDSVL